MNRRVALIIESTNRPDHPMPAHEYYCGKRNRWTQGVLEYLRTIKFPQEHTFFLSFYGLSIIPFHEVVEPYPRGKAPGIQEQKEFAKKISDFIIQQYPAGTSVDLHVSKSISDHLPELLAAKGYTVKIYADSARLGEKPLVYKELIREHNAYERIKDFQKDKYTILSWLQNRTVEEAERIVTKFDIKAKKLGVEQIFHEIRVHLRSIKQQRREADNSYEEYLAELQTETGIDQLNEYLERVPSLSALFSNPMWYEKMKASYGKVIAKFTRYLIKKEYVVQTENRISESLLRLQIAMLK